MKIRRTLRYVALALMASTTLSTTVSAMGLLVAMGAPVARDVVKDVAVSIESEAARIEPASGRAKPAMKYAHETRHYNE